jgi:hypothetical protein
MGGILQIGKLVERNHQFGIGDDFWRVIQAGAADTNAVHKGSLSGRDDVREGMTMRHYPTYRRGPTAGKPRQCVLMNYPFFKSEELTHGQ